MKAPLEKFRVYNEEQFKEIDSILGTLGFDAEAKRMIREELEDTGCWYRSHLHWQKLAGTPRQRAEILRDAINKIESLYPLLSLNILGGGVADFADTRLAYRALQNVASELRPHLDAQLNEGTWSSQNANKSVRHAYLAELAKIWDRLVCTQQPQRKVKAAFLLACSAPVFGTNAYAIKYFLDRHEKAGSDDRKRTAQ